MSPGRRHSNELAARLGRYESRNVTYVTEDFPMFWESARGATVRDVDGNEYIDCTAAFGVANVGHTNERVTDAVARQLTQLIHGMGDVHPTEVRVRLFERLAEIMPQGLRTMFLATTGSEAIEAALKTAMLFTGKSRFAAYKGGYHGLSFGALAVGGIDRLRKPFSAILSTMPLLLDYPRAGAVMLEQAKTDLRQALNARSDLAAIVIEPIQGRGGCVLPPPGYLAALRACCHELGIVLIVDEIFTGFGRTGDWFAIGSEAIVPDIVCLGKALGSGIPISAAIGRKEVMDAWPASAGEALHTSTYLGNPLGCAAALATIDEIETLELPQRAAYLGARIGPLLQSLQKHPVVVDVRGKGLFWGIELCDGATAFAVVKWALNHGVILLQSGPEGQTLSISPPLVISERDLERAIEIIERALTEAALQSAAAYRT